MSRPPRHWPHNDEDPTGRAGLFNTAAIRLYERHGFKEVFRHGDGMQMRLDIK